MLLQTIDNSYRQVIQNLEAIIDSSYDGISITDCEGRVLKVNPSWEKITGLSASEVVGRKMEDLEREGYFWKAIPPLVLKHRKRITQPSRVIKTSRDVLVTGNPIFDENGNLSIVATNVRDMTDLNKLNKQLARSKKFAKEYFCKLEKLQRQQNDLGDIVAVSKKTRDVVELALRVASVDIPVLIQGETGVGKEILAKLIHKKSSRSKGMLMKINCGAIPETLLESELFGYEKGAFTGAREDGKKGLFELSEGGTLFLDEIDALPLNLQAKLLHALQDYEITRIGGMKPKRIDTRIIAASNCDLEQMVQDGTFRKDLFFRLNVISIYIPPLRERKEDILPLLNFFLQKYKTKYKKSIRLSRQVIDYLMEYQWSGNVRELSNLIERLVVLVDDEVLPEDLPPYLKFSKGIVSTGFNISNISSLKEAVLEFEKTLIKEAINEYGSARKAAKYLNVDPSTLTRKLKR